MNEHNDREDIYNILCLLSSNDNLTQRDLSTRLDFSLGKTNYLLKSLVKKGFLKIKSFSRHGQKIRRVQYYLTKKGWEEKLGLTLHFLKKKEQEYYSIKNEWEQLTTKK
jgi:EPS-associated MarR family transcriptional regulator